MELEAVKNTADQEDLTTDYDKLQLAETRQRIYRIVKGQLWERFEESFCSGTVIKILKDSCDICMDEAEEPIFLWECVSENLMDPTYLALLIKNKDLPVIGSLFQSLLTNEFMITYEMLSSLIMSITDVLENKRDIPLHQKYLDAIIKELKADCDKAEERMHFITDSYPEIIKSI